MHSLTIPSLDSMNLFNMNNIIIFFFNHHFFFYYTPSCTDDQVRVDGPLGLIQCIHKGLLVGRAHLHDISPYCMRVNRTRDKDNVSRRAEIRNDHLSFFPYIIIITALILFVFTTANLEVQHCKKNSAYPLKSSGHSLVQSSHVDTAHSCSRWSCRCTGRCG